MIRETFPVGPLQCNCTVLGDLPSGAATVVDPGAEIARILAVLARHNLHLQHIVVTHAHIDHIAGALALKEATGAPILYSEADLPLVAMMDVQAGWLGVATPEVAPPDHAPADAEQLSFGERALNFCTRPGTRRGACASTCRTRGYCLRATRFLRVRWAVRICPAAIIAS